MKRVNFIADNTRIVDYLTTPVRVVRKNLRERGYDVRFYYDLSDEALSCDYLCLISKTVLNLIGESQSVISAPSPTIDLLQNARTRSNKVIWFDSSDSTGVTHFELLPYLDLYLKKQLLSDKSLYRQPFYGGRIFTDFYHQEFGIQDPKKFTQFYPLEPSLYAKVHLSWNIGLGELHHSFGLRGRIRRKFPDLIRPDMMPPFNPAQTVRKFDLFLRTSSDLSQSTISFHRQELIRRLTELKQRWNLSGNVSRRSKGSDMTPRQYADYMAATKFAFGPFGWGEINLREYEAFFFGALLLRTNCSHMETWPDIFHDRETCVFYSWDFHDLEDLILHYLGDEAERLRIAKNGQAVYRESISDSGMEKFSNWFVQQIEK